MHPRCLCALPYLTIVCGVVIVHAASCNGNIAAEDLAQTSACVCVSDIPVMRIEIVNTFITAVTYADDEDLAEEGASSFLFRCHSTPPAFQYTVRVPLHAETKPARHRQKKITAKTLNTTLAAAADAADEAAVLSLPRKLKRSGAYNEGNQIRSDPR